MFRTTRALFRLARITEPDKDELIAFSRLLPGLVYERFDALYPLARALLQGLRAEGVCLHVATHWTVGMARGLLAGGGILAFISVPIFGMDATGTFEKDYVYLALKVDALPECCLVVDSDPAALARAGAAAMQTARVRDGAGVCEVLEMILKQRHVVGDG
jgi:beta-phosphoglucomutase-like phosphatase (HAD superfamily)